MIGALGMLLAASILQGPAAQETGEALAVPPLHGRVVLLGDSITWQNHWCAALQTHFALRRPQRRLTFINRGVRGDTAERALGRFRRDVEAHDPDLVVIALGMNDGGYGGPNERLRRLWLSNMERLVEQVRSRTRAVPVLVTPTAVQPSTEDGRRYNRMLALMAEELQALGRRLGVPVIDAFTPFQARLAASPSGDLMLDDVHPGPAGHRLLAEALLRWLDPGRALARDPVLEAAFEAVFRWRWVLEDPDREGLAPAARLVDLPHRWLTPAAAAKSLSEAEARLRAALAERR